MSTDYETDDFDMEQISGTDNPLGFGDDHDTGIESQESRAISRGKPKTYVMKTRFKTIDKKTGRKVYKIVEQNSSEDRRLLKPYSYEKRR